MRKLEDYREKVENILNNVDGHGMKIPYCEHINLIVNSRAKQRWGNCKQNPDDSYTIQINQVLLDERNPEDALINTLIHEYLHTTPKGMCHTGIWKIYATNVSYYTKYKIKRTSSCDEKGVITTTPRKKIVPKYILKCENCGQIIYRQKKSHFVLHPEEYYCTSCKGKFKRIQ